MTFYIPGILKSVLKYHVKNRAFFFVTYRGITLVGKIKTQYVLVVEIALCDLYHDPQKGGVFLVPLCVIFFVR